MHIAIHLEAVHKPKALKASARLGMQPMEFILHVMAPVWIFAAMNNDGSGDVTGLDDDVLAVITFGRCKSVALLVETGWLHQTADKLEVPRWLEHEPYFAEKARDRQRKRAERQAKSQGYPRDIPGTSTGNPALEEKRREEIRKDESPTPASDKPKRVERPKRVEYSQEFEEFWAFVPPDKKTGKGEAFKFWLTMAADDRLKAIDRMEWTAGCFQALDPDRQRIQFMQDPVRWLRNRKFEDTDEAVKLLARGK